MASSSGNPPPDKNNPFGFNPFKLLGISPSASDKEVTKQWHKLMLKTHPDKVKGKEALATKINQAYELIINADAKRRKELEMGYAGGAPGGGANPSNIIVDKTLSEEYGRVFRAHVEVAAGTRFKDNFQSFYQQVFDEVETHPRVDSEYCELCDEEFLSELEHEEVVFNPYVEYLMGDAEPDLLKYLESLFGEEIVRQDEIEYTTGIWGANVWTTENTTFRCWTEFFKTQRDDGLTRFSNIVTFHHATCSALANWIGTLPNLKLDSLEDIAGNVLSHFGDFSAARQTRECDIVLPAYLQTIWDFKDWTGLALKFASLREPRWALLFARAGSSLDTGDDDNRFLKVGDALVSVDWRYAHICYLLGSYELTYIAERLITRSSIPARKLAVHYFLKVGSHETLVDLGKAAAETDRSLSVTFLLPLFLHYFEMGSFPEAINLLGIMLPRKKLWKGIESMVAMEPELIHSEIVASHAIRDVEETCMTGMILSLAGIDLGDIIKNALAALAGALHVLASAENLEGYAKAKEHLDKLIPALLETALNKNQLSLLVAIAKLPGAASVLERVLTEKRFLGPNPVTAQPGQLYHSALLLLRGMYNYKIDNISGMVADFTKASASVVGNKLVSLPIADFLTGSPLVHERILESTSLQFSQLQDYMDSYTGGNFNSTRFSLLMSTVTPDEGTPLSQRFPRNVSSDGKPDLHLLERDVLGRDSVEEVAPGVESYSEKAFAYVNLTIIAESVEESVLCFGMAAVYFFKAMLATPDTSIPEKFGYHGLILKCMKELKPYSTLVSQPPSILMFVRRLRLSFIFMANHHFSQTLQQNTQRLQDRVLNLLAVNFLDENKIPKMSAHWQTLVNTKLLCPISTSESHTIQDGGFAMAADIFLNNVLIMKRIEKGVFSANIRDYLYRQILFNEVWTRRASMKQLESIKVEFDPEEESDEDDSEEEKERKLAKNQEIRNKKKNWKKELNSIPIVQRGAFQSTRAEAMKSLANLHGYGVDQVEHMMAWHPIRRTEDGFIDPTNRSLNFNGEQTFTRFHGVRINPSTKVYELLLEPSVPGDMDRPPLFTMTDINEIFGLEISDADLSFDEIMYFQGLPEFEKVKLPVHPFFHVWFQGYGPDGKPSKERICGTNFLMTLYHLDLLAKILTTGQEVGAIFPFPFKDTENHLLKGVDKELLRSLMPIGPRKKARLLRNMEVIHRFWFHVDQVEQMVEDASDANGGVTTFRYGNVSMSLKTMPMVRGEDGKVIDAESLMDVDGPEVQFVREFNKNMGQIEKLFPIIQRTKELAKISVAFQILHVNKDSIVELDSSFSQLFGMTTPQVRPYSQCGGSHPTPCICCDWVPAVYAETLVTDEQKLEHLFGNRFFTGRDALSGAEKGRLTFPGAGGCDWGTASDNAKQQDTKNEKAGSGDGSESSINFPQWNLIERYRVYGGVQFRPLPAKAVLAPLGSFGGVNSVRMTGCGGQTSQQSQKRPPPPPPPSKGGIGGGGGRGGGGRKGGKRDKKKKKKSDDPNYIHPNNINYLGPKWLYEINKVGSTAKETGKKGIGADPPVMGKDGKPTLPRMQRQLDELNKSARDSGKPNEYEGTFKDLPYKGTRVAKWAESLGTKFDRRFDNRDPSKPKSLPLEKGRHVRDPTKHYYPDGKPPMGERRFDKPSQP